MSAGLVVFHEQRRLFMALFLLGLIPRLMLVVANTSQLETWEYDTLARNIASGIGYVVPRFGRDAFAFGDGNLYTFLAAVVYVLVGYHPVVMAIVQAVLASLVGPLVFEIGRRAFGLWPAALGGALAALHPGLLAYSVKLHPLGLDVVLLALDVLWIGWVGDRASVGVSAGLTMGATLMTRPTFFVASAVGLGVRWINSSRRLMRVVLPIVVALAIAAPWIVRNWAVLGRPVFISTSLEDVWKGNNPFASGSSYLPNGQDVFSAAPPEFQARLQTADELQLNDIFASQIADFVQHQPGDFAVLTARKFVYFWWASPQMGLLYPSAWLRWYQAYAVAIGVFAAIAIATIVRVGTSQERALLYTLVAMSLTVSLIHALSYVEGRHRWGIEPLLLLLTARGIFVALGVSRLASDFVRRGSTVTANQ